MSLKKNIALGGLYGVTIGVLFINLYMFYRMSTAPAGMYYIYEHNFVIWFIEVVMLVVLIVCLFLDLMVRVDST